MEGPGKIWSRDSTNSGHCVIFQLRNQGVRLVQLTNMATERSEVTNEQFEMTICEFSCNRL